LENNIIFSDRIGFFENFVYFIPTEDNPRSENKKEKTNQETKESWVKKNSNSQNQAHYSKKEHKKKR